MQLVGRRLFAMGLIEKQADGRRALSRDMIDPHQARPIAAKSNILTFMETPF
jgi:hypothetical protein